MVQTLNNFGGIIGKILNFGPEQLFFQVRDSKQTSYPQIKTLPVWGEGGVVDFVVCKTQNYHYF